MLNSRVFNIIRSFKSLLYYFLPALYSFFNFPVSFVFRSQCVLIPCTSRSPWRISPSLPLQEFLHANLLHFKIPQALTYQQSPGASPVINRFPALHKLIRTTIPKLDLSGKKVSKTRVYLLNTGKTPQRRLLHAVTSFPNILQGKTLPIIF